MWIDFDGVYKNSDVWLNGAYLGHHTSGYVGFRYFLHNVTAAPLRYGKGEENVIAVRVDALSVQEGWFYEGGGIYRHVSVSVSDPLSIVPDGVYAPSAVTGTINSGPFGAMGPQSASSATVMPQCDVFNGRSAAENITLLSRVLDSQGIVVGETSSWVLIPPGGTYRMFQEVSLTNISLWNTAAPYLYSLESNVWSANGSLVDSVVTKFGLRSAVWSPNEGFQLNGFKIPVKGFSNHQSFGGCGNALPERVEEYRLHSLKALGANLWRASYPYSATFMDLSDVMGMMLWVENRLLHYQVQPVMAGAQARDLPPGQFADPQLLQDAQDMAVRARNHPSVVIYSLCNEANCLIGDPNGGLVAAEFKAAINAVDWQHPITANTEWSVGSSDTLTNILDVMTTSYNYGTYEIYHRHHPFRPFM